MKENDISIREYINDILEEAKKINKDYNYFNVISEELALKQASEIEKRKDKGKLNGLAVSVKDCICVKDVESTAGSHILKDYKPVFNATVVEKIIDEGGVIIGKTSQDEFGFGGFNINVGNGFKIPKNPYDKDRVTGGSSGGAAGFTAKTKYAHIAIAESTGGSVVNPASFCGVYGFCPSYGIVSRYGLIDYANSLDKIGVIAEDLEDCKLMFDVIKGYDEKDSTSLDIELNKDNKIRKVGLINLNIDKDIKNIILNKLKELNFKYDDVKLPLTEKYGIACYYLIALSESSTNLAKYCGLRYGLQDKIEGNFNEYFSNIREKGFGKEAKRRILLGTFARMAGFRDAYYIRAMKVRTLIINEYKKLFGKYDLLVSATMPIIAPKFSEVKKLTPLENYMIDILTVGPNLAGLPHLSINAGFKDKMPLGILFIADHFN